MALLNKSSQSYCVELVVRWQRSVVVSALVLINEYWPVSLGLRRGVFTCVGWQVTLGDLIWQVTLRSSDMGFH